MSKPATINDGGPAFPVTDTCTINGEFARGCKGMSLRAYFAGQVLNMAKGMEYSSPAYGNEPTYKGIAARAVLMADALIAELNKSHV